MRTIHKFEIPLMSRFDIDMDVFGRILSVQKQHGRAQMWVLLDSEGQKRKRTFYLLGTGHEVPNIELKFIDTVQFENGHLVMHLFEDMTNTPSLTDILWTLAGKKPPGE